MEIKYRSGAHTRHRMIYHIVWVPKYRKRLLYNKVKIRLRELLEECAEVNNWQIIELAIEKDHVHVILQSPPKISVSEIVRLFKGGSSIKLREEFPELMEFLWGDCLWAEGYFVETVGKINEKKMQEYVRKQGK